MQKRKNKTTNINKDDIVLVSIREYELFKADVLLKYNEDEIKILVKDGELPPDVLDKYESKINDNFVFEDLAENENESEEEESEEETENDESGESDDIDIDNI